MATAAKSKSVDLTTGIGILSFPHLYKSTASKDKKTGELGYDVQILIPKTDKDSARAILAAIKEVGESKWGDRWKQVKSPLRDGDKEKNELTEDGSTKGEKYPERLGHYFLNARSSKPPTVVARDRSPIEESDADAVYGGVVGRISVTFYAYSKEGNHGVGAGLNGVQKIRDGEPFGQGRPSAESMFDLIDDEDDDLDLDDELDDEPEEAPAPKRTAKKAPAKKAVAKKAPARKAKPVVEEDEDDLLEDEDDEEYDDLDDL